MLFIIKFFNSLKFFPYLVITLVPYSFGNTLEDIRLGKITAQKKKQKTSLYHANNFTKFA